MAGFDGFFQLRLKHFGRQIGSTVARRVEVGDIARQDVVPGRGEVNDLAKNSGNRKSSVTSQWQPGFYPDVRLEA